MRPVYYARSCFRRPCLQAPAASQHSTPLMPTASTTSCCRLWPGNGSPRSCWVMITQTSDYEWSLEGALRRSLQDRLSKGSGRGRAVEIALKLRTSTDLVVQTSLHGASVPYSDGVDKPPTVFRISWTKSSHYLIISGYHTEVCLSVFSGSAKNQVQANLKCEDDSASMPAGRRRSSEKAGGDSASPPAGSRAARRLFLKPQREGWQTQECRYMLFYLYAVV